MGPTYYQKSTGHYDPPTLVDISLEDTRSRMSGGDGLSLCGPRLYTILTPVYDVNTDSRVVTVPNKGYSVDLEYFDSSSLETYRAFR